MTEPLLSIVIATLNRGAFIGATLDSILPQTGATVEVLVVDGASTDETPDVVGQFATRFANLRYVRLPQKSGVDQDYDKAVGLARGEYCWLMTDDDVLRPGAVARVLDALSSRPDLVIVNAEVRGPELRGMIASSRLPFRDDRHYEPGESDRLFADTGAYLSFIGAVVIRRSIWQSRDRVPYFGSLFIHVGVIFQGPLAGRTIVVADPLITIRYGNAHWTARAFEIWMFKWPEIVWSLPGLTDRAREAATRREPWSSWRALFVFRAMGAYGLDEYRRWIAPRLKGGSATAMARMIATLPGPLVNLVAWLRFRTIGRENGIALFDVETSRFFPRFRNRLSCRDGS